MDLELIDQQSRDNVYVIDGWANRGVEIKYFNDPNYYTHKERVIIKSKSIKINERKIHRSKPHINALPYFKAGDFKRSSKELAVSVAMYHSDLDNWNEKEFQETHVKGGIWAGLSFIANTDLSDNKVPLYFHIEDRVWDSAKPVLDDFGIPSYWCRKIECPKSEEPVRKVTKPQFGKGYMGLLDDDITTDIILILDADLFTCAVDEKINLFDKLTSPILKRQPSLTYFTMRDFTYSWYVSILLLASGLPDSLMNMRPLDELEAEAYERLGFERERTDNLGWNDVISRYYAEDYMMTFPSGHKTREYAISRMDRCYAPPYIFAAWSEFNYPFIDLSQMLGLPIYDWESTFIDSENTDCFAHIRVDKCSHPSMTQPSRMNEYFDRFLENVSRYVIED